MSDPLGLGDDAQLLFEKLAEDGSTTSNPILRCALGWEGEDHEDQYFAARDALEDAGLVVRGRGRGGTVRRVVTPPSELKALPDSPEAEAERSEIRGREIDLYEPMARVIRAEWAKDHRVDSIAVEVTAHQGRRATGIWARPDVVSVEVRTFAHVPGRYIEVVTFEIKPVDSISVQAVYEALAHRRASTHSYVLLYVPDEQRSELEVVIAEISEVARGHGIGVITAGDPGDYETWEERESAIRVEPDPGRLDAFLAQQLSPSAQHKIQLAVR